MNGTLSRSALETFHACPRKRYLAYEWMAGLPVVDHGGELVESHVGGLSSQRPAVALLTGFAVHTGFEYLLDAVKTWESIGMLIPWTEFRRSPLWQHTIGKAAQIGLDLFREESAQQGISFGIDAGSLSPCAFPTFPNAEFYETEQRALVEGLIWVAGLRLVPEMVGRYKIMEVEREERLVLANDLRPFAARADALLEDRTTGDLSVFSLKTAAMYGRLEEMKFKRDVQGLSEAVAVERRLEGRKIESVQMALLLKGARRASGESRGNRKEHYSPLTRAWRMRDELTGLEQWAWSYDTPKTGRDGSSYMGKLGKDWRQAQTWEYPGGVSAWVLALDRREIQADIPIDPLLQCMAFPEPWGRSETELEDWLEQARVIEREIQEGAEVVNHNLVAGDLETARKQLNIYFPQDRRSCVAFNSTCIFDTVCWGGKGLEQLTGAEGLPEGLGLRKDHHSEEGSDD